MKIPKRAARAIGTFATVLLITFGIVGPGSATVNPTFTSTFSFSAHLYGATQFKLTSGTKITVDLTNMTCTGNCGSTGNANLFSVRIVERTCQLGVCGWNNVAGAYKSVNANLGVKTLTWSGTSLDVENTSNWLRIEFDAAYYGASTKAGKATVS